MNIRQLVVGLLIAVLTTLIVLLGYTRLTRDNKGRSPGYGPDPIPVVYTGFDGLSGEDKNGTGCVAAAALAVRATVHITTKINQVTNDHPDDADPAPGFFSSPSFPQTGSGSGVLLSEDGYIVTNNHVIAGASEIHVTLSNGKTVAAKLVGADPVSDLAVLKIQAHRLPILLYGNSDEIKAGQWVLAVGYPLNLQCTVTAGIVSVKGKRLELDINHYNKVRMQSYIQTDVVINHGSSGGPLINTAGRLIGVNAYLASPTGAYTGYSFTIPVNTVRRVVHEIITKKKNPGN
ncbi:MAG TPA: trypsin-like peptidase domain-containing protein [Chitinophagaceae bacterium]|jgi:S1-C subfamily serine protease